MKNIAIVGSGISGLTAAYLLDKFHHITLFEANDYFGGHSHTVSALLPEGKIKVDTGFIVFNKKNYPKFTKILDELKINYVPTEMSFSYFDKKTNFQYNGNNLFSLFSQKKNIFSLKFYRLLKDILYFNQKAKKYLKSKENTTLKTFVSTLELAPLFWQAYFAPMIAAIWSSSPATVEKMPAKFILQFLNNHGLLDIFNRPQWYTIKNGSENYVKVIIKNLKGKCLKNTKVQKIHRHSNKIEITTKDKNYCFDKVIIATHSDQALSLLATPTEHEKAILGDIQYQQNDVLLHTDISIMPTLKKSWAAWNYFAHHNSLPAVTYYMNRLQPLATQNPLLVSVNLSHHIDKKHWIQSFNYAHPILDQKAVAACGHFDTLNGKHNTYYCGAYWGYGFHEDGVNSAFRAVAELMYDS